MNSKYDPRAARVERMPGGLTRDWGDSGGPPDEYVDAHLRRVPEPHFVPPSGDADTVTEKVPGPGNLTRTVPVPRERHVRRREVRS
jgi:hypothetical protein